MKILSIPKAGAILCIYTISVFLLCTPVYAAESFILTTKNAESSEDDNIKFHYLVDAGDTIKDVLHIKRKFFYGQKPSIDVNYYTVDARMTQDGFISMASEFDTQKNIGEWTSLDTISNTIQYETDVPFSIKIPKNATPGQYIGGFILVEKEPEEPTQIKKEGNTTKIRLRYATTISIDVQGDINTEFDVQNINYDITDEGLKLSFDFLNNGNVIHEFTGHYTINGIFKDEEIKIPIKKVLPGEKIKYEYIYSDTMSLLGGFDVNLHLDMTVDFSDNITNDTFDNVQHIKHLPTTVIVALLLIFLAIYAIIYRLIKGSKQVWITYTVKNGENIFSIAKAAGTNWRKLAHRNHIKPPYILETKQKIIIPTNDKENIRKNNYNNKK